MTTPSILLCTVGTSLHGNLKSLRPDDPDPAKAALAGAYASGDPAAVAEALAAVPVDSRVCGAEINSVASLVRHGHVADDCGLYFFHSATADGRAIARVLTDYFRRGHAPVTAVEVGDLQDADPRRFRTHGLRNLARTICKVIRDHSAPACAINATGGYKAQIAVGVLLGQALGVPVYYKHELFNEVIAFPPLPVALDFEVWMRASGLLFALDRDGMVPALDFADGWDEKYEALVERDRMDGVDYLAMAATGQIFQERFRSGNAGTAVLRRRDRQHPAGIVAADDGSGNAASGSRRRRVGQ